MFIRKLTFNLGNRFATDLPAQSIPSRSEHRATADRENFNLKKLFSSTWQRVLLLLFLLVCALVLFSFVGRTIFAIFFTVLPLFIGYAISFLLQPLIKIFARFLSLRISKIIVFVLFTILVTVLVIGIMFVMVFQMDELYQQLLQRNGNEAFRTRFLDNIRSNTQISNLQFTKITNTANFQLVYDLNGQTIDPITVKVSETADIYLFFLKIISVAPFLQRLSFTSISGISKNLTNYEFINELLKNYRVGLSFFYLVFFTLIIAAYTLDDKGNFFRKIGSFVTKKQDPKTTELLKIELKKGFASWFKALILVQTYILIFTAFFIFVAGILFYSGSTYLKSILVLSFFMFLCNLVPYIGPVIGFIPIVGIGIVDAIKHGGESITSWAPLLIAACGCLMVQIGESAFVSPLVYSQRVKIKPITVIIALSLFGVVFGVFSMPFAIPIIILTKIVARVVYKKTGNI